MLCEFIVVTPTRTTTTTLATIVLWFITTRFTILEFHSECHFVVRYRHYWCLFFIHRPSHVGIFGFLIQFHSWVVRCWFFPPFFIAHFFLGMDMLDYLLLWDGKRTIMTTADGIFAADRVVYSPGGDGSGYQPARNKKDNGISSAYYLPGKGRLSACRASFIHPNLVKRGSTSSPGTTAVKQSSTPTTTTTTTTSGGAIVAATTPPRRQDSFDSLNYSSNSSGSDYENDWNMNDGEHFTVKAHQRRVPEKLDRGEFDFLIFFPSRLLI